MSEKNQRITKDIQVFQLLHSLSRETDKLIKLTDDIDAHALTPQAKSALNIIANQVQSMLKTFNTSLSPLYKLYELDPGMKKIGQESFDKQIENEIFASDISDDSFTEASLWSQVEKKNNV